METFELFALAAALLFCLAVLRRSTSPAVQVVRDPVVAHRLLNETAGTLTSRPNSGLVKALATWTGGPERTESITTVAYGAHWRSVRANLTAGFLSPSRITSLAPLQRDAIQELVAGLPAGEVVMREHLSRAMFALAARMCFGDGVEESRDHALEQPAAALGLFAPLGELVRPLIAAARARDSRHAYVDSLVHLRVADDDDDGKRALRESEILGLVAEFLATNWKVVVACMEWTLASLVIQPEVQEKLRREVDETVAGDAEAGLSEKGLGGMPYLRAVVLESLRMHPPSPFVTRGIHDLGSGRLRRRLVFMVQDIGRHGGAWTDPDEFRPERFLPGGEAEEVGQLGQMPGRNEMRMMPFGGGRRFCPGYNLAFVQTKFFVTAIVRHFELAPPSCGIDMTGTLEFNNYMKKPLRVRVIPRTLP
ncbi:hypothetical protein ACQ4PT_007720 [Festuca glaucescens]